MILSRFAEGLWELNAPLSLMGMHLGHRMTVARLPDQTLWVHSPSEYAPALGAELQTLGTVEHVVAPNAVHDTYLESWFAAYPRARFHAAPGVSKVRPDLKFNATLSNTPDPAWLGVFDQHVLRGIPRLNEVVFLHIPSRSLILTDLVFNLGSEMPFLSRVLLRLNDSYCKFGPSRLMKSVIKDRAALRRSLDHVFSWDFDAIIVSHGENVPTGAKPMLREAFTFL
jgi:hypothetical protein